MHRLINRIVCSIRPLYVARTLSCIGIVLILNTLVNMFNRFISELWLCGDTSKRSINCATLLFALLLYLVTCQPRCYVKFCVALIQAELLLQCFSFLWVTQICSVQIGDLIPALCDTAVGTCGLQFELVNTKTIEVEG
jgi:hypothetical protein